MRCTKDTSDGSFITDLLEQYKLCVQVCREGELRAGSHANRYLLAINAALEALNRHPTPNTSFGQT